MSEHDFDADTDGCCRVCGAKYHCARCNGASSMMGHYVTDDRGGFFRCEEPERWERRKRELGGLLSTFEPDRGDPWPPGRRFTPGAAPAGLREGCPTCGSTAMRLVNSDPIMCTNEFHLVRCACGTPAIQYVRGIPSCGGEQCPSR